ncbi:post-transcriptional regulator [Vagococcus entomophilus]|uniref:Post-transcriptional regulator n=1 Tax=Vagococcus entomophilus TaxID=1160095 RepID=A0A430AGL0_9ENTE|nr:post-transcriptional regulator [Vagococcus entomophilus]RSU07040.1 hypothetical protein CBF30_07215 [Vagococcus entomophilus]
MPGKATKTEIVLLGWCIRRKYREFLKAGYTTITKEALWEYVTCFLWKREKPTRFLDKKQQILHMTANDFFDYQQIKAQVEDSRHFDWKNIEDLF